jgi:hypothetical protein
MRLSEGARKLFEDRRLGDSDTPDHYSDARTLWGKDEAALVR